MVKSTRNSSVDEVGERYSQIPITVWSTRSLSNFTTPVLSFHVTFVHLIGESRLFRRIMNFFIIAPYKYSYLHTDQFFVDSHLWQFYAIAPANHVVGKFLLEGLECNKDTQMKAYNITELTV